MGLRSTIAIVVAGLAALSLVPFALAEAAVVDGDAAASVGLGNTSIIVASNLAQAVDAPQIANSFPDQHPLTDKATHQMIETTVVPLPSGVWAGLSLLAAMLLLRAKRRKQANAQVGGND